MRYSVILILCIILPACRSSEKNVDHLFTILSGSETGINFTNELEENDDFNIIEYLYFNNGAGVAAGDINNDGLTDLYFTANQKSNKLYLNKGNLKFEDITDKAGVSGKGNWKTGVTIADVNGDGFNDIYVCQVGNYKNFNGRNQLFINQGNTTFKEEAHLYGIDFQGFSTQCAFFDFDLDGDLDMYLLNHSVHTSRSYGDSSLRFEKDSLAGDRLYRNDSENGKRVFHDVTDQVGIYSSQIGYGLGIAISDINNDHFPDIYISNDFHENDYLYINNGDGTFNESLNQHIASTSRSSMGNDIADINNDGLQDIFVLDMLPDDEKIRKQSGGEDDYELFELKKKLGYNNQFVRNTLQLNLGSGLFSEIGRFAGVYSTDWSWSPLFCDLDNDGRRDLFVTTGIYRRPNDLDYIKFLTGGSRYMRAGETSDKTDKELYVKMPLQPDVNRMYVNNADLTFKDVSQEWNSGSPSFSNGAAYSDLDNDGDLDLIVNNINSRANIYRNNSESVTNNHFITVKLKGNDMNINGIGTKVYVYSGFGLQMSEQFTSRGFMSSSSDILHFGLGKLKTVDSVKIIWPDSSEQLLRDLTTDIVIKADYKNAGKATFSAIYSKDAKKLFSSATVKGLDFTHKEDDYSDFNREHLIPQSLTAEGPALASGDLNGDGLDDLFAGGAKDQLSVIYFQQNDGSFKSAEMTLSEDDFTDDVDAALFDADGDGDSDIYVVHGGNEYAPGNPLLMDKLLINNGKGKFKSGKLPLISHNGSCVRPCDYDGDGDQDLFIGSRSVPGAYGLPPENFLLQNNGTGSFTRDERFNYAGMITDAVWTDFDGDKDVDLILAGEWMNVTVLKNDKGKFSEVTAEAGLDKTEGWWNCIHAADIDKDGDMDLIAGNLGLNSILKASQMEPVEMYLNDFDNNGRPDQIISIRENGKAYPIASLDELESQIPGMEEHYPSYSGFGGKTTEEIFGRSILDKSMHKRAVIFESCIFRNNGNGNFMKESLPARAQLSPVRDLLVLDINKDIAEDIIIIGNNYTVRPSIGGYDASFGWCLLGDSVNRYQALMPGESGLIIKGDARKIVQLKISGKLYFAAGVNNGRLQLIKAN
jgi:enediyne biosynthesis protein E4